MIILDTHIWIWWVHDSPSLPQEYKEIIQNHEASGLGISAISCWEVAKLVEYGRLQVPCSINEWMDSAINYPGIQMVPLSPEIAIESTKLPGAFHKDPADQIIVATSRVLAAPLLTLDEKLRSYPHVQLLP